jgi:large subunit ribosomal protein L28
MSNICDITGKGRLKGNRVSHANNKNRHFQQPNLQERRLFIPELGQKIKIKVSTAGLRTLDKLGGLSRFLIKAKPEKLTVKLRRIRKILMKKGIH